MLCSLAWVKICCTEVPSLFTQQKELLRWELASRVKMNKNLSQLWPGGSLPARLRPAQSPDWFSSWPLFSDCYKVPTALVAVWNSLWSSRKEQAERLSLHTEALALPVWTQGKTHMCSHQQHFYVNLKTPIKGTTTWVGLEKLCSKSTRDESYRYHPALRIPTCLGYPRSQCTKQCL